MLPSSSGKAVPVQETLEIPVKAGWKEGTKVGGRAWRGWA